MKANKWVVVSASVITCLLVVFGTGATLSVLFVHGLDERVDTLQTDVAQVKTDMKGQRDRVRSVDIRNHQLQKENREQILLMMAQLLPDVPPEIQPIVSKNQSMQQIILENEAKKVGIEAIEEFLLKQRTVNKVEPRKPIPQK